MRPGGAQGKRAEEADPRLQRENQLRAVLVAAAFQDDVVESRLDREHDARILRLDRLFHVAQAGAETPDLLVRTAFGEELHGKPFQGTPDFVTRRASAALTDATVRPLCGAVVARPDCFDAPASASRTELGSSTEASESARLMYLLSIASATRSVRIGNAYFVPDRLSVETLVAAQRRGVRVEIIVPGRYSDAAVVRRASRSRWGPLLEAGVSIYEYRPTMYHTKVMIVDDVWASVGSTNFDSRSFRLNDEANLNILDPGFAREQAAVFEEDRARSTPITLAMWNSRPRSEKIKGRLAGLLRLQL